jgi:hypothetical protein
VALPLSEAITAGQAGHVAAHNDIHDVVNEAARTNVANTFAGSQTISTNGGKTTLALTDTTADVGITIGADTNLYRSAANTLKTDDTFIQAGLAKLGPSGIIGGAYVTNYGDTGPYLEMASSSVIVNNRTDAAFLPFQVRGMAGQTGNLQRWTDGSGVILAAVDAAGKLVFGPSGSQDTNLYRSAANELATDDIVRFNAAGTFQTTVGAAGGGSALPATPTKYLKVKDEAGTTFVVPCYAAA